MPPGTARPLRVMAAKTNGKTANKNGNGTMLLVEQWPLERVREYERNPRKNDGAVAKVAASLKAFGFRQPIVVDEHRTVIAGHTRLKAARSLGMATVPVHVATGLTAAQVKAYRLADNRTAEEAEWDARLVGLELGELKGLDFDLSLTGFDPSEIAAFTAKEAGEESEDVDLTPPKKPKSERGIVYELGKHRVLCGDATDATAWDALMAGTRADMVWTDPPYGVSQSTDHLREWDGGKKRDRGAHGIENDGLEGEALEEFLRSALSLMWTACREGAAWYVAGPANAGPNLAFSRVLMDLGVWKHSVLWVKDSFVLGRSDYHYRHEEIFYGWKEGAGHHAVTDRTQDTVWEFPRPKANDGHPTKKPVELVRRSIENSSDTGERVIDGFAGSGTTMIACEQTARVANVMELDPRYCDVIRRRYAEFVNDPTLAP